MNFFTLYTYTLLVRVRKVLPFIMLLLYSNINVSAQYLHTDGEYIVNGNGDEVILRGMGLGGWMLQEGYMLETSSFANTQHKIRSTIEDLIGMEKTDSFYNAWLANHCTKRDIDSLASWGFNSVRLPMHYNLFTLPIEDEPVQGENTWLDKGFALTDSLVKWCKANEMYVILDLHAAPGGQGNDAAISDYDDSKPSLWESDANKQKTVALWRKLAERYADERWIGGYDLINETNWNFTEGANENGCDEKMNEPLKALYVDITDAIREVDQHHIIFIEGNCWANNHNGLLPVWDDNMAISFHKYWNYNDQNSIQGMLNIRDQYDIPLWMGESGENSNTWFTNAISLLEKNKIGWSWWPLKKVGSIVNPLTIVRNEGYADLLDYWENGGAKPSVEAAKNALMQLTENLKIENCIYRKDVIDAMFRQVQDLSAIPYEPHKIPGVVNATDFDLGRNNIAYFDVDTANYRVSTNTYTAWNSGWNYRNDGVDIEESSDAHEDANGYDVGWTADGEWMQYTLNVDSSAVYKVDFRYASQNEDTKIKLRTEGTDLTGTVDLASTGGYQQWGNQTVNDLVMYKGEQKLRVVFEKGGANFSLMDFQLSKKINEIDFSPTSASITGEGVSIILNLNKKVDESTLTNASDFSCFTESAELNIGDVSVDPEDERKIILSLDEAVLDNTDVTLSYNGEKVKATDGTTLVNFKDLIVVNNIPFHFEMPTHIEAEEFVVNNGLQLEETSDTGGGQDVGYTNTGDYLDYNIRVPEAGRYYVDVRIACQSNAGRLKIGQLSNDEELLNKTEIDVPVTGGWQIWETIRSEMNLDAGNGILRVTILQPEFNINWFDFSKINTVNGLENDNSQGSIIIYPNPCDGQFVIRSGMTPEMGDSILSIMNPQGDLVFQKEVKPDTHSGCSVKLESLAAGLYVATLNNGRNLWRTKIVVR